MKIFNQSLLGEKKGILVHGVNCRGVMGSGIAFQIRNMYPKVYDDYIRHITNTLQIEANQKPPFFTLGKNYQKLLGDVLITKLSKDLYFVSGFTQLNFGKDPNKTYASLDAIYTVFTRLNEFINEEQLSLPIKIPKIGSGHGNLPWEIVQPIVQHCLKDKEIELYVL
jgi:O-acetyl-ADP-ribose deacetylase (regulator of RNase III)